MSTKKGLVMASRNERKRLAKARSEELRLAVEQAFKVQQEKDRAFFDARADYVSKTQDALRFHRNPSNLRGKVQGGKFVSVQAVEPKPRKLTLNPLTGKLIEKRKTYI